MKIFITGGTGFIGKPVVDRFLSQGHSLLLLSRNPKKNSNPNLKIVRGELGNIRGWQGSLKDFNPDAAIHIAWEGLPDHSKTISQINLKYGLDLTKALAAAGCKLMLTTGSCWEYGYSTGKLSEDTFPKPFDDFTAAKNTLRKKGLEIAKKYNMAFIWTRLFYAYGTGQHPKSLIPYILNSINSGKIPEIRNPNAQNDFIYVDDIVDALTLLVTKNPKNDLYNIGSGKLTTVSDIIKKIFKYAKNEGRYREGKSQPKDANFGFYADISRISNEFNWQPKTTIDAGIKKIIFSQLNTESRKAR